MPTLNDRDTRDHIEVALERQIRILQWLADGGEALDEAELLNHAVELRAALQIYGENLARKPDDAGYTTMLERLTQVSQDPSLTRETRWQYMSDGPPAHALGGPCPTCRGTGRVGTT